MADVNKRLSANGKSTGGWRRELLARLNEEEAAPPLGDGALAEEVESTPVLVPTARPEDSDPIEEEEEKGVEEEEEEEKGSKGGDGIDTDTGSSGGDAAAG